MLNLSDGPDPCARQEMLLNPTTCFPLPLSSLTGEKWIHFAKTLDYHIHAEYFDIPALSHLLPRGEKLHA